MTVWIPYTDDWDEWQEKLPSGKHLSAYRHPAGYVYIRHDYMPGGWVTVKPHTGAAYGHEIEKHCIDRSCGWLEIECIMHEMRSKYGS